MLQSQCSNSGMTNVKAAVVELGRAQGLAFPPEWSSVPTFKFLG